MLRVASVGFLIYAALILSEFDSIALPVSTGFFDIGARVVPFLLPALFGIRLSLLIFIIFRLFAYPFDLPAFLESPLSDFYVTGTDRIYTIGLVSYCFIAHLIDMQRKHEEEAVQQEIDSKLQLVRTLHDRTARQLTHALMDLYMRNPSSPTTAILESAIQSLQEVVQDVRSGQSVIEKTEASPGLMTQTRPISEIVNEHADLTQTKGLTFTWDNETEHMVVPAISSEIIFNAIKYAPTNSDIELIFSSSGSTNLLVVINEIGTERPTYSSGFGLESVRQDLRKLGGACITLIHKGKHYALMQWPVDVLPDELATSIA